MAYIYLHLPSKNQPFILGKKRLFVFMGIRHGIDPNDPGADYENAIREGSTSVRVGSSIFGARHYPK